MQSEPFLLSDKGTQLARIKFPGGGGGGDWGSQQYTDCSGAGAARSHIMLA
jgi:hypothetical protein